MIYQGLQPSCAHLDQLDVLAGKRVANFTRSRGRTEEAGRGLHDSPSPSTLRVSESLGDSHHQPRQPPALLHHEDSRPPPGEVGRGAGRLRIQDPLSVGQTKRQGRLSVTASEVPPRVEEGGDGKPRPILRDSNLMREPLPEISSAGEEL